MFRDPTFYLQVRQKVVPMLRTYPFVRIWHAGCSTGEEVYSMAILLQEEGLYDRCRIYATDINDVVLQKAKTGIFPLEKMQEYTENYIAAGGKRAFSDYYLAKYGGALFDDSLSRFSEQGPQPAKDLLDRIGVKIFLTEQVLALPPLEGAQHRVRHEILRVVDALQACEARDITVCVLERPRHDDIVAAIRATGAKAE